MRGEQTVSDVANTKEGFVSWLSSRNENSHTIDEYIVDLEAVSTCYSKYVNRPINIWEITNPKQIDTILNAATSSKNARIHFPAFTTKTPLLTLKKYLVELMNSQDTTHIEWRTQSAVDNEIDYKKKLDKATEYLKRKYSGSTVSTLRQLQKENSEISFTYFNTWTQKLFGKTASQYLTEIGILSEKIVDSRSSLERLTDNTNTLKNRYSKVPAENLSQVSKENPDISISMINIWTRELFNQTAKEYLIEKGIISSPLTPVKNKTHLADSGVLFANIATLIKEHYPYGFKYDSIREIMRLRQFADANGIVLPESDDKLKKIVVNSGYVIDGKVFVQDEEFKAELQRVVDEIFDSGVNAIYYDSLFLNRKMLMEHYHIVSADQLKEYLVKTTSGFVFSKRFMTKGEKYTEREIVSSEIIRVWGNGQTATLDELNENLPYIPLENIWRVISGNDIFLSVSEGKYLLIERLVYSNKEIRAIKEYVKNTCKLNGYASLSDIPLGIIEEENYEIPFSSLIQALFRIALSNDYHLNGRIITKDKTSLDSTVLLKQYVKQKEECTFAEVEAEEIALIGISTRQDVFQVLFDCMIRVDKDRFISDKQVNFNVKEIDNAISHFIKDGFCAIRDITTFALFPVCGQNWNLYLLESYCYRYSQAYNLRVIRFNDKNAGIIAEKKYNKSYIDILSIVLARSDVELNIESAGQFLSEAGYLTKKTYGRLEEIILCANRMRKELT